MKKILFTGVLILAFTIVTLIQPISAKADPAGAAAAIAGGIILTGLLAATCWPYYAHPPAPGPHRWGPPPPYGPPAWIPPPPPRVHHWVHPAPPRVHQGAPWAPPQR